MKNCVWHQISVLITVTRTHTTHSSYKFCEFEVFGTCYWSWVSVMVIYY